MRTVTKLQWAVFISILYMFAHGAQTPVFAAPPICDDVCFTTPPPECYTGCYADMMQFDNGNETDCNTYTGGNLSCCGDNFCDTDELEAGSCTHDCGQNTNYCNECDPTYQTGCSSGQECSTSHCCINIPNCDACGCDNCQEPPPNDCTDGYCYTNSDCCNGDSCFGAGQGSLGVCVPTP